MRRILAVPPSNRIITSEQFKAARADLYWSRWTLAVEANLSERTVFRIERGT